MLEKMKNREFFSRGENMFRKMTLKNRLLLSFLAVGVIPFAVIGLYALYESSAALEHAAFNELEAVCQIKHNQIEYYFQERKGDLGVLAETVNALRRDAIRQMESLQLVLTNEVEDFFHGQLLNAEVLGQNASTAASLQHIEEAFLAENKKVNGAKWTEAAETHGAWLASYSKQYDYSDLLLISRTGDVVFSVAAERDLGQNLATGELRESPLGKLYQKILRSRQKEIVDFAPYAPSGNHPECFVGAPILKNGEFAGMVAFQMNEKAINHILQVRAGRGKTGESYLVGPDRRMRSDSFLDPQNRSVAASFAGTVEKNGADTEQVRRALAGQSGHMLANDYRGQASLCVYNPVRAGDITWALVSEIDIAEAFCPVDASGQEFFATFKEAYGYYDLLLINPEGYCFYSVEKEEDFQSNFLNGKTRGTHLGKLVRQVMNSKEYGIADYAPYAPSNNEACAFAAMPVVDEQGAVQMVVAVQLSPKAINDIMQERTGMGKSGETYLVGMDKLMRSDSYLDPTNRTVQASFANPGKGSVDTEASREALAGRKATKLALDYNGNSVLSAYEPIDLGAGITWAILAEIDEDEAFAAINTIELVMAFLALVGVAAIIAFALLLANSISNPISAVVTGLTAASEQVASASEQMSTSGQQISEGASEQASTLEQVSSSLEEMTSMTRQNADNSASAEKLAAGAQKSAQAGNSDMDSLNNSMEEIAASADEMQKIIKNIEEIAVQTNMLALNAAVEAARAGEHGRGFAVVAEEVRNLARKSAEFAKTTATLVMESTDQIRSGREVTKKTAQAFHEILEGTTKVSELMAEIAAASQEQARGLSQITQSVTEMDKVVQENAATAEEGASVSEELSSQASNLNSMVVSLAEIIGMHAEEMGSKKVHKTLRAPQKAAHAKPAPAAHPAERKIEPKKAPVKPQEVFPLNEEEFKDF